MAARQRTDADNMDVVFRGHARRLFRLLEERADIHVEAEVGVGRGNHFRAAVVAVLAHLGDEDARPAAMLPAKSSVSPRTCLDLRGLRRIQIDRRRTRNGSQLCGGE